MARDAVTLTTLSTSALTNTPAGTTINTTNGASIDCDGDATTLILRITNTNGSDRVATILAGDNPPAFRAGLGDLALTVPATSGDILIAIESARFMQDDGCIYVDFAASFAGKISAFRPPKDAR